ncbi:DDE-type integrase/transposase/recombinase, partial [uncultured Ruegeria sp.]|uniref:DDE-type integrase/transposase/recombinase n=1 Tax=uncultured Ruegeria sp. TaxID=259304 RepID=UPI0026350326
SRSFMPNNNIVEQDHRFIKRRLRHMCGFESFRSASATLDGIEVVNMIRKQQFPNTATFGFRMFAEIAG